MKDDSMKSFWVLVLFVAGIAFIMALVTMLPITIGERLLH